MNKSNLLKEAILDAKLIKETAVNNAKKSLTESLTPHIKEMFASKIDEMENESEEELDLDEVINEIEDDEVNEYGLEHDPSEIKDEDFDHPSLKKKKEAVKEEEAETETEKAEDEELDLENMTSEEFTEVIKDVIQDLVNSGEVDLVPGEEKSEVEGESELEIGDEEAAEGDEEVNIDELLSEIDNEIKESKKKAEKDEKDETIKELKVQLNESKLFSSKLLYANKLFVKGNLSEKAKVNILESLDKASNVKEAKLIYEALNKSTVNESKKSRISEIRGSASKTIITKASKPIINIDPAIKRMQKLAGIED